jgi:LmbE family N-acetylglucosaminyl deacetylase
MSDGMETISVIEKYVNDIKPDMVFLPSGNDVHQDHRAVHFASLVAVRLIDEVYLYQAPSTTMGFSPTVYFDITDYIKIKVQAVKIHSSQ